MKRLIVLAIVVSLVSLVLGIIARLFYWQIIAIALPPRTYLLFAGYCLGLAIALELYPSKK
jgi:hypothetical protein